MAKQSLLDCAIRWKSFWLYPIVFIFFISSIFSLLQLRQSVSILEEYHDTSVWTLFQINTEFLRFQDSLNLYERDSSTLGNVQERYDILWSRFPIALKGVDADQLSKAEGVIEKIDHAFSAVQSIEPIVFEKLPLNPALTKEIKDKLQPHIESIKIISLHNFHDHNDYHSSSDERVASLQDTLFWLMLGFIVSGSLLLLMVIRENKINLYQAEHDSLTGMPNRAYLKRVLSESCATGSPYALHLIDLNGFKDINDTLGHHAGDLVLQSVSARLKEELDVNGECVTCRLGGDEFAIVQFETRNKHQISRLAKKIIKVLSVEFLVGDHHCHIGASIGSAIYPEHGRDGSSLLSHADIAMYQAKSHSPESTQMLFTYKMLEQINRRHQLQRELQGALINNDLHLEYQPIISLKDGEVASLEALLRWEHRLFGAIPPLEIIDIAEQYGITHDLCKWLVTETANQIKEWNDEGVGAVPVSINISPSMYQIDLVELINSALDSHNLPHGLIWIEITEDTSLEIIDEVKKLLPELTRHGIRASLDDFGTGLSSLSHLRQLPIHTVKIDRSFIGSLENDVKSRNLVKHIISIGHDLGMNVVAEGIEDEFSSSHLQRSQCDYAQGYYYSRPLKPEAMSEYLLMPKSFLSNTVVSVQPERAISTKP